MQIVVKRERPRDPVEYIMDDPPIPITDRRPDLPAAVAAVVDKAVQKDIDRRFQGAPEFKAELERVMKGL